MVVAWSILPGLERVYLDFWSDDRDSLCWSHQVLQLVYRSPRCCIKPQYTKQCSFTCLLYYSFGRKCSIMVVVYITSNTRAKPVTKRRPVFALSSTNIRACRCNTSNHGMTHLYCAGSGAGHSDAGRSRNNEFSYLDVCDPKGALEPLAVLVTIEFGLPLMVYELGPTTSGVAPTALFVRSYDLGARDSIIEMMNRWRCVWQRQIAWVLRFTIVVEVVVSLRTEKHHCVPPVPDGLLSLNTYHFLCLDIETRILYPITNDLRTVFYHVRFHQNMLEVRKNDRWSCHDAELPGSYFPVYCCGHVKSGSIVFRLSHKTPTYLIGNE